MSISPSGEAPLAERIQVFSESMHEWLTRDDGIIPITWIGGPPDVEQDQLRQKSYERQEKARLELLPLGHELAKLLDRMGFDICDLLKLLKHAKANEPDAAEKLWEDSLDARLQRELIRQCQIANVIHSSELPPPDPTGVRIAADELLRYVNRFGASPNTKGELYLVGGADGFHQRFTALKTGLEPFWPSVQKCGDELKPLGYPKECQSSFADRGLPPETASMFIDLIAFQAMVNTVPVMPTDAVVSSTAIGALRSAVGFLGAEKPTGQTESMPPPDDKSGSGAHSANDRESPIIDIERFEIRYRGKTCKLGGIPFRLFQRLSRKIGTYISVPTLLSDVWDGDERGTNTIQQAVSAVRQKLKDAGISGIIIDGKTNPRHYAILIEKGAEE